jgi:hypothetical protein
VRKATRALLALAMFIGLLVAPVAASEVARAADPDIKDRLLAIPGVSLIEEKPVSTPGYRFFLLNITQPVDHRRPNGATFQQRISVLHKDVARPMVFFTSGYGLNPNPSRSEPTRIVDGNQVSMEYRFFTPSRPEPADWSDLTIWQAASDQHRIFQALKPIYAKNWLATGGSKGGMTATYYQRFYPKDMNGTVPYVAPNDVVNIEDSAYDRFFATVGPADCRARAKALQREALVRRPAMFPKFQAYLAENQLTVDLIGTQDKAFEGTVLDFDFTYWQYYGVNYCDQLPVAATITDQELFDLIDGYIPWNSYTDQGIEPYIPYFYQAGTQLGWPNIKFPWIERKLQRYPYQPPRAVVPDSIPMRFDPTAMWRIDTWVRNHARNTLYVYGENDPWGSERFRVDRGAKDSYVLTVPNGTHQANVAGLAPADRDLATAKILEWAGVASALVKADTAKAEPLAEPDGTLDRQELRYRPARLP